MKPKRLQLTGNEDGSISVMALFIMLTLAIAGLMVTNDAVMESQVGRNYGIHKQCMAGAEAAGKEIIQAIDSVFSNSGSMHPIAALNTQGWRPHDGYNTTFTFDQNQWGTYRFKDTNVESNIAYLSQAEAIAVLIDAPSVLNPGLGGSNAPQYYTYTIYCRAEHAGAGNSQAILMMGYRQIHT